MASAEASLYFWNRQYEGETADEAEERRMVDEPIAEIYPRMYEAALDGSPDAAYAVYSIRQIMLHPHPEWLPYTFDDALNIWNKSSDNPERNQGEQ